MVPLSLVPALALLFFYVSTFRSMCAVPNVAVFCSSLTSWFPGMLLTYFLNDLEMVPVAPITTGITLAFTFHMRCISIVRSLYFKIFSASFLTTVLSPEISTSINMHILIIIIVLGRGVAVDWGSSLQAARSRSLEVFIDLNFPVALWPWGPLSF